MPNLKDIVEKINSDLTTYVFNTNKYQAATLYNIADYVLTTDKEEESIRPYVVDNFGEMTQLSFDDTSSIQGYHIIKDLSYEDSEFNFGSPNDYQGEVAKMKFILFGNRLILKVRPEHFIAAVAAYIFKENKSLEESLGLIKLTCDVDAVEHVSHEVFKSEFSDTPYDLPPNIFMCSLSYTIKSSYGKNCFNLCK